MDRWPAIHEPKVSKNLEYRRSGDGFRLATSRPIPSRQLPLELGTFLDAQPFRPRDRLDGEWP
jgi:hypothetical protein